MKMMRDLKPFASLGHFHQNSQVIVMVPTGGPTPTKMISQYSPEKPKKHLELIGSADHSDKPVSIWVQYLDQEPTLLSLPSSSVIYHIKKEFIESLNSPLATYSPGAVYVFKNRISQKPLEANESIKVFLHDNHYSNPLVFRNSNEISTSSQSSNFDAPISKSICSIQNNPIPSKISTRSASTNVLFSQSISTYNSTNSLHHSFYNSNLVDNSVIASKISQIEEIEDGEIKESKIVPKVGMNLSHRKSSQIPTPSPTAAQSPTYGSAQNSSSLKRQAPQVIKLRDVVSKLNNVVESKPVEAASTIAKASPNHTINAAPISSTSHAVSLRISPSFPNPPVSVLPPTCTSTPVKTNPAISNAESSEKIMKKPFVNIRTFTSAAPIPRRPLVNKKAQPASPHPPGPPSNTPVSNLNSKWPAIRRGTASAPSTILGSRGHALSPATPSLSSIPSSVKILKRPLAKSVTLTEQAKTGPSTPRTHVPLSGSSTNSVTKVNEQSQGNREEERGVTPITMKFKAPASVVSKLVLNPNNSTATAITPLKTAPVTSENSVATQLNDKEQREVPVSSLSCPPVEKSQVVSAKASVSTPVTENPLIGSDRVTSGKKRCSSALSSEEPLNQKKKMNRKSTNNYNAPVVEGFHPPKKFEFQFRSFLGVGTMKEKYQPIVQTEGTKGVVRVESLFQSITAMPVYMEQSIEELRWEDYVACRKTN